MSKPVPWTEEEKAAQFRPHPAMLALPNERLVEILDNPAPVGLRVLLCISWWFNIPRPAGTDWQPRILEAMAHAGSCKTNSEARRLVQQGGVMWNGQRVTNPKQSLDFIKDYGGVEWGVIKVGKHHYMIIRKQGQRTPEVRRLAKELKV